MLLHTVTVIKKVAHARSAQNGTHKICIRQCNKLRARRIDFLGTRSRKDYLWWQNKAQSVACRIFALK